MGDVSSGCTIRYGPLTSGVSEIWVETADTVDTADTVALTLSKYGITTVLSVRGWVHTTSNSVVAAEEPTTAVSAGVLTITVGGSTVSDKMRVYRVVGKGTA